MPVFLTDALTDTTFELERAQRLRVYSQPSEAPLSQVRTQAVIGVLQCYLQLLGFELVVDAGALPAGVDPKQGGLAIEGRWVAPGAVAANVSAGSEEITRYALMNAPYRQLLGAELPAMLEDAERKLEYFYATRKRLTDLPEARIIDVQTPPAMELSELRYGLASALDNDLDLPRALSALTPFLKTVNELCDGALRKQGRVNRSAVEAAEDGFATIKGLLAIGGDKPAHFLRALRDARAAARQLDTQAVEAKIQARVDARAAKDFTRADTLQAELLAQGVTLLDHANGTDWVLS